MADKPSGDKTEQPTAKKKRESRKKGMAPRSSELPQAVSLVVAAVLIPNVMPGLFVRMGEIWRTSISPESIIDPNVSMSVFGSLLMEAIKVFIPMVGFTAFASVAAQFALTGGRPNPYKLKPQWASLNPWKGIKRLVSLQVLWDLGRTLTKLLLLIALTWGLFTEAQDKVVGGSRSLSDSLGGMGTLLQSLIIRAALAAVLVGVADAIFNKKRFLKQIRMTKQEVRDENKQQEVAPEVKGEIRRRQLALSRNRMISNVANADVVITNPTHIAIALAYEPDEGAPRVLAKGAGRVAERIREEALKHGVPIRENKPLARAMFRSIEVDQLIPVEFFAAVAAVLAAVFRARKHRSWG